MTLIAALAVDNMHGCVGKTKHEMTRDQVSIDDRSNLKLLAAPTLEAR